MPLGLYIYYLCVFKQVVPLNMKGCICHFCKVADTPFHIQGDDIANQIHYSTETKKIFCGEWLVNQIIKYIFHQLKMEIVIVNYSHKGI